MLCTKNYWDDISKAKEKIHCAQGIVVGAGAGLSAAAGLQYSGERFEKLFPEYKAKYALQDMYAAAFYPFKTIEEFWGYFSKHIYYNRYAQELNDTYDVLRDLLQQKNYFIITTNVDHIFQKSGFDKNRLFYTQGDYGLLQCSVPCHQVNYDNEDSILPMIKEQKECKIPPHLIPYCPQCKKAMTTNLRKDNTFVEDEGWHAAQHRYAQFIEKHKEEKIVFLELGVGYNTPSIIKFPFWHMTQQNKNACYININTHTHDVACPAEIQSQAILFNDDISTTLKNLAL